MEEQAAEGIITILADRDVEGYARTLLGVVYSEWKGLASLRVVNFADIGLSHDTSDRVAWRFAQANRMVLLTANRNMIGEDSLQQTLDEENHLTALPVLTISRPRRMIEPGYRSRCAARLIDIVSELDRYKGVGRIYIP